MRTKIGADRLALAAAAVHFHPGRNTLVIGMGSCITYNFINKYNEFLGGAIAPGPYLMEHALHTGTAQLPEVPLELPPVPLGRSTREAIQVGILYGFIDGVRGMLDRLVEYLGEPPYVVATGGWAPFLEDHVAAIDAVDPHLVLRGVRILAEMND